MTLPGYLRRHDAYLLCPSVMPDQTQPAASWTYSSAVLEEASLTDEDVPCVADEDHL